MHRSVRPLCVALIAMSPVQASAVGVDWRYWGRFVAKHGCEAAVGAIAGKWKDEGLMIAGEVGKRYGCPLAVEKLFGRAPDKKTCSPIELQEALNESPMSPFASQCKTDMDCMARGYLLGTGLTRCEHSEICGVPKGFCVPKERSVLIER